ncbi:MAG: 50S ribosomal protein L9 [Bacteroidales bacterium]|nr:50S ribosomal protein L9 [Bacteroidales bacterium]
MEIILNQDIPKLGYKNEIVTVKNGYGRNYLIPQGYAIVASESAKKQHTEKMKQRAHKEAKIKTDAEALAAKLEALTLTIGAKASSTGKIFGSVNTIQIAEAIEKQGFSIDRKMILIKESSIKELGDYNVTISLYKGVDVKIPFKVVAE